MGFPRPDGNWKGYDLSDLSAKASQFHGKNFFLIHGTADDNVHFQQSMVLTRALVDQNILFRLQVRKKTYLDRQGPIFELLIKTYTSTCINWMTFLSFFSLFFYLKYVKISSYLVWTRPVKVYIANPSIYTSPFTVQSK